MYVDTKGAAVDVDMVIEGVMRAAPAVAWEDSHSERVPVGNHLEVCVPDARPNGVLEVRAMCSQEKTGCAWEELPWYLRCMRRDCGEASSSAHYAFLESSSSPVAWVELFEASRDVSCSVLLDLLGMFVLEFLFVFPLLALVRPLALIVDPALRPGLFALAG